MHGRTEKKRASKAIHNNKKKSKMHKLPGEERVQIEKEAMARIKIS